MPGIEGTQEATRKYDRQKKSPSICALVPQRIMILDILKGISSCLQGHFGFHTLLIVRDLNRS